MWNPVILCLFFIYFLDEAVGLQVWKYISLEREKLICWKGPHNCTYIYVSAQPLTFQENTNLIPQTRCTYSGTAPWEGGGGTLWCFCFVANLSAHWWLGQSCTLVNFTTFSRLETLCRSPPPPPSERPFSGLVAQQQHKDILPPLMKHPGPTPVHIYFWSPRFQLFHSSTDFFPSFSPLILSEDDFSHTMKHTHCYPAWLTI